MNAPRRQQFRVAPAMRQTNSAVSTALEWLFKARHKKLQSLIKSTCNKSAVILLESGEQHVLYKSEHHHLKLGYKPFIRVSSVCSRRSTGRLIFICMAKHAAFMHLRVRRSHYQVCKQTCSERNDCVLKRASASLVAMQLCSRSC